MPRRSHRLRAPAADGETLLREMEAKIIAAKTLRVEFEIVMNEFPSLSGGPPRPAPVARGFLVMADRNRFRHELKILFPGYQQHASVAVSDGKRVGGPHLGEDWVLFPKAPLPDCHNEVLRSWLGRGGTLLSLILMSEQVKKGNGEQPKADVGPRASKVRRLPDEEVGGVKARVVCCDLLVGSLAA